MTVTALVSTVAGSEVTAALEELEVTGVTALVSTAAAVVTQEGAATVSTATVTEEGTVTALPAAAMPVAKVDPVELYSVHPVFS